MLTTPKATAFRHPMSVVRFVATLIGRRPARDAAKDEERKHMLISQRFRFAREGGARRDRGRRGAGPSGVLDVGSYARSWQRKREWCERNGFVDRLITSADAPGGGSVRRSLGDPRACTGGGVTITQARPQEQSFPEAHVPARVPQLQAQDPGLGSTDELPALPSSKGRAHRASRQLEFTAGPALAAPVDAQSR
jgi:hypothetical protein